MATCYRMLPPSVAVIRRRPRPCRLVSCWTDSQRLVGQPPPRDPVPCDTRPMAKRPPRPRDPNQLAKLITEIATGERENVKPTTPREAQRKGGLKGGKARAKKLSGRQKKAIARKAAKARWAAERAPR